MLLVDVFSILHRSHHTFGSTARLRSPDGLDTSALRGLLLLVRGLVARYRPSHLALVSDSPGELARRAAHPGYKAGRPPTPDGVLVGAGAVKAFCRDGGIPWFGEEGLEADDLIAALVGLAHKETGKAEDADGTGTGKDEMKEEEEEEEKGKREPEEKRNEEHGHHSDRSAPSSPSSSPCASSSLRVLIVSSDRDFNQLLGPCVTLLRPSGAGIGTREYSLADFCAQFPGIEPPQYAHLLALAGDRGDGIQGVRGLGPKGALELLRRYGSVEGVIRGAGDEHAAWQRDLERYERSLVARKNKDTTGKDGKEPEEKTEGAANDGGSGAHVDARADNASRADTTAQDTQASPTATSAATSASASASPPKRRPKRPKAPSRAVQAMAQADAPADARLALSLARLDTAPPPEADLGALRVRRPADGGRAAAARLEQLGFGTPLELLEFIYDATNAVDERFRSED